MAVDPQILELLVCPESRQPLHLADDGTLSAVNERIQRGELKNRMGHVVSERVEAALVREDGIRLYRIDDGIPNLLIDEQIALDQVI
ncbi:MAG: hypothetical protein OXU20_41220 [Myxococcales bacterium]|nr:hypothetical protein [Myxococcales bacterium]MDD9968407.1 hypothetical protein [Myxococcales bacterium]